jgi:hypothetical protein
MRRLLLPLLMILVGCGGSGTVDPIGGTPTNGTPQNPDPGAGEDAGTSPPGTDAGGDASTKPKDTRIDPIEVGRSWTYDVTVLGFYPACSNGTYSATAQSASVVDGRNAIFVTSFCPGSPGFNYSVDGDRVFSHYLGSWIRSLDAPVQQGHEWTDGYLDYKWESKGTQTVPAGTFTECWSATTIASYTSYILLCRGVGPVKWHFEDGFGNGYEAILKAKSF